jgi:hypothetical protein
MFGSFWSKIVGSKSEAALKPLPDEMLSRFVIAIKESDADEINKLVISAKEQKYDLNTYTNMQFTLLHFALTKTRATKNEEKIMQIICSLHAGGADINKVADDQLHATPLHTACRRGLPAFTEWLLLNGANPDARDSTGKTPIDYVNHVIHVKQQETSVLSIELNNLIATREIFAKYVVSRNQP